MTPIREVDDRQIGEGKPGPITKELQSAFFDIVKGKTQNLKSGSTIYDDRNNGRMEYWNKGFCRNRLPVIILVGFLFQYDFSQHRSIIPAFQYSFLVLLCISSSTVTTSFIPVVP